MNASFKYLSLSIESGVLSVAMHRPPVNGVDRDMYIELAELFTHPDRAGGDLRAIVLSGVGPHFCAGNDLDEFASMTPANGTERMWRVREAFFAIQECPLPVIAAVHGAALGTGLAIAASCDFIVATKDARFALPELTVGVMGGARHLARIAPQPLVRRMFFTGEHILAADFAAAGASLTVCEGSELHATAHRFAQRIATLSPTAVRLGKQILNRIEWMDLRAGYEFEQGYTVRMSGHPDSKEALTAFRERREPRYAERAVSWKIEV
ncbi:enoyl-CoA hydratase-related protein [Peristeroidobacter soli]|uniref:enoyl-CoA hydratase-related protein n=1 Tax=Peristeroidobacter soli TaxID=2497877 RepID=UPI00101C4FF7|nr:enoyl-CoA hydratase-related protein [Peristeroidobacter soli]